MNELGMGVGLRPIHYPIFTQATPPECISWVEALTENYLPWKAVKSAQHASTPHGIPSYGTRSADILEKIREKLPVVLHGVSMNLGSTDPLSTEYLGALKDLASRIEPEWISDHLCWTGVDGLNLHDLYPLPYTEEAVSWVVSRIGQVQDFLGRRILVENVSSYLEFDSAEMNEADFVAEISRRSGCRILLDLNNVYVSGMNHGFNPRAYLEKIPFENVGQIHLAGHTKRDGILIDTHDQPVSEEVWELFRWYTARYGKRPTMIERDARIPAWAELEAEVLCAKEIRDAISPA